MKAAVYYETGPPAVLFYEDVPEPSCHPRGVLIDVEAIGIEGVDVLHRGYQFAGRIREIGSEFDNRVVGERVVATVPTGSHAETASVAAHGTWRLPDGMAIEHAACVPIPFGTADDCLFEFGGLQPARVCWCRVAAAGSVWPRSNLPSGTARRSSRRPRTTESWRA